MHNGAILENYVVSEIRKNYLNLGSECLLYYYRDKDDKEIDLCIEIDGKLHPIEIKRSSIQGIFYFKIQLFLQISFG